MSQPLDAAPRADGGAGATVAFRTLGLVTAALIAAAVLALALWVPLGMPSAAEGHGWLGPAFDLTAAAAGVTQAAAIATGTTLVSRTRGVTVAGAVAVVASLASAAALVAVVLGRPALDLLYGVVVLAWVPLWAWSSSLSRRAVNEGSLRSWVAHPLVWLLSPLWFAASSIGWRGAPASGPPWHALVGVTAAFSWLGLFVHNIADLPGQTILSPESLYPTLVTVALVGLWLVPATRTAGAWALLAWAMLSLVGGSLSVLPLPILPFAPDQSFTHYAFHAAYAATQLPLIAVCIVWLRRRRSG